MGSIPKWVQILELKIYLLDCINYLNNCIQNLIISFPVVNKKFINYEHYINELNTKIMGIYALKNFSNSVTNFMTFMAPYSNSFFLELYPALTPMKSIPALFAAIAS